MNNLPSISALTIAAAANQLAKIAKARRSELAVGTHDVEDRLVIDVKGIVEVREDDTHVPKNHIPLELAFALFIHHSGVTGPAAIKALVAALTAAHAIGKLSGKDKEERIKEISAVADLDNALALVQKELGSLPKKHRRGAVRPKAEVSAVDLDALLETLAEEAGS